MTDEEIQRLLDEGKTDARHVEALKKCGPGAFCVHRSWGFGRIASFDAILGKFLVDFKGKAGHPMEARYAAESLEILPADHVLARKVTDLDSLKRLAGDQPLELMRVVLTSFGGQATIEQITTALCPEVVATADWKKWWDGAKRVMRKDPHFVVGARKTEPCLLRGEPMRPEQELLKSFEAATGLKEKTGLAEQLLRVADQVADAKAVLEPVIHALSAEIKKSLHHEPATTLEAIWVRDELANLCGHQAHHTVGEIHEIVKNVRQLGELLESLPATKQKRLLPHVRTV
ncbi:MAG: hypothetical protein FJ388_26085, partial [Verrucomicrobia bacterium]|nr:hypothetical protein [Verrucomicrobiota bacterium]